MEHSVGESHTLWECEIEELDGRVFVTSIELENYKDGWWISLRHKLKGDLGTYSGYDWVRGGKLSTWCSLEEAVEDMLDGQFYPLDKTPHLTEDYFKLIGEL